MSHVTQLTDDFDEKIADLTARLQQKMTYKQYGELLNYLRDKKLAGATRHIEHVLKQHDRSINKTGLALLRKYTRSWHQFYREVISIIDDFERFLAIVADWNDLMERNGGPKHAAKLAKKEDRNLPAAPLPAFAAFA